MIAPLYAAGCPVAAGVAVAAAVRPNIPCRRISVSLPVCVAIARLHLEAGCWLDPAFGGVTAMPHCCWSLRPGAVVGVVLPCPEWCAAQRASRINSLAKVCTTGCVDTVRLYDPKHAFKGRFAASRPTSSMTSSSQPSCSPCSADLWLASLRHLPSLPQRRSWLRSDRCMAVLRGLILPSSPMCCRRRRPSRWCATRRRTTSGLRPSLSHIAAHSPAHAYELPLHDVVVFGPVKALAEEYGSHDISPASLCAPSAAAGAWSDSIFLLSSGCERAYP